MSESQQIDAVMKRKMAVTSLHFLRLVPLLLMSAVFLLVMTHVYLFFVVPKINVAAC